MNALDENPRKVLPISPRAPKAVLAHWAPIVPMPNGALYPDCPNPVAQGDGRRRRPLNISLEFPNTLRACRRPSLFYPTNSETSDRATPDIRLYRAQLSPSATTGPMGGRGEGRLRRPWDPGARGPSGVIPKLFRMESNSEWNVISIGKRCREQTSSGANTNDEQFLEMMCQGLVLSGLSQLIV